jgi:competence ComEA-like helix-hairpin-helix protein
MARASASSDAQFRAAAFVALLLALSAGARWMDRPRVDLGGAAGMDLAAHEAAVRRNLQEGVSRGLKPGEKIDPNSADERALQRLPRVGPALAARIVAERANAPFTSAADLTRVSGIGPAMIAALTDHVTLPAASPAAPAPARPAGTGGTGSTGGTDSTGGTGGGSTGTAASALVDVNRATAAELERLPGIGPALAQRIVAYRDSAGGFATVEQLERVRGIGPALRGRIAPLVVVR